MSVSADVRIPIRPITVEDYERMVDAGILGEDDRVELLNGQLSEKSPMSPEHAQIVRWLTTRLIRAIDPGVADVGAQLPLRLPPLSMPEPDIAIIPAGNYAHAHPTDAFLVIEIAVSSLRLDLGTKAELYAAAGLPEYWVLDLPARTAHIHHSPTGTGYASCRQVTHGNASPAGARGTGDRRRGAVRAARLTWPRRRGPTAARPHGRAAPKAAPPYRVTPRAGQRWKWPPLRSPSCLALPLPLPDFA